MFTDRQVVVEDAALPPDVRRDSASPAVKENDMGLALGTASGLKPWGQARTKGAAH